MADPNQPAWRGNAVQRFGRGFVDRVLPGNQRAPDGTLQNVGRGLLGAGVRTVGGLLGPGGSIAGSVIGANIANNGNPLNFQGSRLGNLFGAGGTAGVPRMGIPGAQPQPLQGDPGANVSPLSLQLNAYRGAQVGGVPRMAIPGADPRGTSVPDAHFGITPLGPSAMQFRGADGQMVGGSGGNPGGLAGGVGRGGAGIIDGEAAQDFMRAAHQSIFGNRQTGTDPRGNTLAQ